uniref:Uncharacterized protein n=1 Tax=Arundo donax TaxID=35708 RepID=A0A0A8YQT7_ARUDO
MTKKPLHLKSEGTRHILNNNIVA